MRHTIRVLSFAIAAATLACGDRSPTSSIAPSDAPQRITNGTPTGTSYGNVGNVFVDEDGDGKWDWRCSGTLISATVFLTAGHCYEPGATYYVTFAPVAFPAPADLRTSALISSTTAYRHPDYLAPFDDIAVIILPANDVAKLGITPMPLAPEGYLTELRSEPAWGQKTATVVGYGLASYGQGPYVTQNDAVRRYAELKMLSLDAYRLVLHNNAPKAGQSGVCYGDSGGPVIVGGYLVAVASYVGLDLGCHSLAGFSRVDTESALGFLDDYVTIE